MIISVTKKPGTLPQPSTRLQGKQICMYDMYTTRRKFAITPDDKFQEQLTLTQ